VRPERAAVLLEDTSEALARTRERLLRRSEDGSFPEAEFASFEAAANRSDELRLASGQSVSVASSRSRSSRLGRPSWASRDWTVRPCSAASRPSASGKRPSRSGSRGDGDTTWSPATASRRSSARSTRPSREAPRNRSGAWVDVFAWTARSTSFPPSPRRPSRSRIR
jgi:hypothetical protein